MFRAGVSIAAAALLGSGCQGHFLPTGETRHESKVIELDKAEAVRAEIRMGAGALRVNSGNSKLLEADFTYNVPEWKPVVEYRASGQRGDLTISQPKSSGSHYGNTVNTWNLKLNADVSSDVTTDLGAGEVNLELGRMNLHSVDVRVGAGELKMDLRGEPKHDYTVQIHGGVGEATVLLPKDVGISATAAGGIGGISVSGLEKRDGVWINPERVHAPVTVHLDVKGGVGEIRLVR
jgi:hypothetical protein